MADKGETGKRTPRSEKLPQADLESVSRVVGAINDLAGPSSRPRVAQQMGATPTSSSFKTVVAAAKYMGLVKESGRKLSLESRGERILSPEAETARLARQDAVMASNFGELIRRLSGRGVDEAAVSARLQEDYGVPEGSAPRIASILRASATAAGLVQGGYWDARAIESSTERLGHGEEDGAETTNREVKEQPKGDGSEGAEEQVSGQGAKGDEEGKASPLDTKPGVVMVNVNLNIDPAQMDWEDILMLLRELKKMQSGNLD